MNRERVKKWLKDQLIWHFEDEIDGGFLENETMERIERGEHLDVLLDIYECKYENIVLDAIPENILKLLYFLRCTFKVISAKDIEGTWHGKRWLKPSDITVSGETASLIKSLVDKDALMSDLEGIEESTKSLTI